MRHLIALGLLCLGSAPVLAGDSVSLTLTGVVAPRCEASAFVRQTADVNGTAIGIGYDVNTQTTGATSASSVINLANPGPQRIADLTARCNTGSATLSMQSDNGFKLVQGAGGVNSEVPFSLNLLGQGGSSGIAAGFTTTVTGTGPGPTQQQVRALEFVLPAVVNPIDLIPGTYSDTIRVTITPNP